MIFTPKRVLAGSVLLLLTACSNNEALRQAKQDFKYLDTPPLGELNVPAGSQLPVLNDYDIPAMTQYQGPIGSQVDIRPPVQVLALIPGARTDVDNKGNVQIWLAKPEDLTRLWRVTNEMLVQNQVATRVQTGDTIETDWISWEQSGDDNSDVKSRYVIRQVNEGRQAGLDISLVEWQRGGQQLEIDRALVDRYSALMTNLITVQYDEELRAETLRIAQEQIKQIPVSMGRDRSGLPVIIARTTFDVFWERAPSLLDEAGFTLDSRNRSQGELMVKFKAEDDEYWEQLGVKPIRLDNRTYRIQLGDLGNRTSINITDTQGKALPEEALQSLAVGLGALLAN
uniref:outer membrane protein assembly factor BamC n=1 Tax=Thaumasiovibrio occultus TaxID=1891184 RepID=UPI000B3531BC|nr:outer membrane protein assembly factor BamC [Thaumasiovibrio occultus]